MSPGFTFDEPLEQLGERLILPDDLEPLRPLIETRLPPLHPTPPQTASSMFRHLQEPELAPAFLHRFVPAIGAAGTTLLLLHGTGGDENSLIGIGQHLAPGAALLSPAGNVLERGARRFFRRHAEGLLDQEDLAFRTHELATFVEDAIHTYGLVRNRIVAVGFSNGANIATSLLLRRPGLLRGAILLSPMLPFEPDELPNLTGTAIFIGAGRADPLVPPGSVERLAEILREAGARVMLRWEAGGHELSSEELRQAGIWLSNQR